MTSLGDASPVQRRSRCSSPGVPIERDRNVSVPPRCDSDSAELHFSPETCDQSSQHDCPFAADSCSFADTTADTVKAQMTPPSADGTGDLDRVSPDRLVLSPLNVNTRDDERQSWKRSDAPVQARLHASHSAMSEYSPISRSCPGDLVLRDEFLPNDSAGQDMVETREADTFSELFQRSASYFTPLVPL